VVSSQDLAAKRLALRRRAAAFLAAFQVWEAAAALAAAVLLCLPADSADSEVSWAAELVDLAMLRAQEAQVAITAA
jgi:hypothetical protein